MAKLNNSQDQSPEWLAGRSARVAEAMAVTEPDGSDPPPDAKKRTVWKYELSPAERLGLTVRSVSTQRTVVVCPFCGGERHVKNNVLAQWASQGRVPSCEAVRRANRGTECRQPNTEEASGSVSE